MQSADSLKLIERAASVALASSGVYLILSAFIMESPWQIILPIIGVGLIVGIVIGLHKRPLRFVAGLQPQWFTIFLAILLPLVCFPAFGMLASLFVFGLTLGVPLPEEGGTLILIGSVITSIANFITLILNSAAILRSRKV